MTVPLSPGPPGANAGRRRRVVWARRWLSRASRLIPILTSAVIVVTTALVAADTAQAADAHGWMILAKKAKKTTTLAGVIDNLRLWLLGIIAAVATLFLMVGALRYLAAGGDPGQVEKAKSALKSAAIGYGLALLAPVLITLIATLVT
jgi:beta-lactamase regulating signal transducer with metallopeptidase domain